MLELITEEVVKHLAVIEFEGECLEFAIWVIEKLKKRITPRAINFIKKHHVLAQKKVNTFS